jgi:hypothetical protein
MGWILRRGISCCRWAREDCHLVLCGLEMLALSHWERRALVQAAMIECGVVLRKALLLLEWEYNDMELGELPRPRHYCPSSSLNPTGMRGSILCPSSSVRLSMTCILLHLPREPIISESLTRVHDNRGVEREGFLIGVAESSMHESR